MSLQLTRDLHTSQARELKGFRGRRPEVTRSRSKSQGSSSRASKPRATSGPPHHHRGGSSPTGDSNPARGALCHCSTDREPIHMLRLHQGRRGLRPAARSRQRDPQCRRRKLHDQFTERTNHRGWNEVRHAGDEVVQRLRRAAIDSQPTIGSCERASSHRVGPAFESTPPEDTGARATIFTYGDRCRRVLGTVRQNSRREP